MKKKKKIKFDNRWKILSFSLIVIFTGIWYSNRKANYDLSFQENKDAFAHLETGNKPEETNQESEQKIEIQPQSQEIERQPEPATPQEIEGQPEPTQPQEQMPQQEETDDGKININTATAEELNSLPGIGDALSKSIIVYREEKGGFQSIEELKNIDRIGEKTFEKLKDKVKI